MKIRRRAVRFPIVALAITMAGLLLTVSLVVAPRAEAASGLSTLYPGQSISNSCLFSPGGSWELCMQGDGNLVEYQDVYRPKPVYAWVWSAVWSTGTYGHPCVYGATNPCNVLVMQGDGNLVVYGPTCAGPNKSCWNSGTGGNGTGNPHLAVQDDGNVVVYVTWPTTRPVWDREGFTPKTDPTYLACRIPSLPGSLSWSSCEPSNAVPASLPGAMVFNLTQPWQLSNGHLLAYAMDTDYVCGWFWAALSSPQITAAWDDYLQQQQLRADRIAAELQAYQEIFDLLDILAEE